jgi:L-fuconolactonase
MAIDSDAWLNLTKEDPIEPDIPICDPHMHLWEGLGDRYLPNDFLRDIKQGHNIVKTVFIQTSRGSSAWGKDRPQDMQPVGETEFIESITARNASKPHRKTEIAAGIVGFADLTLGSRVTPVLEAHIGAGKKRFRGIRQSFTWDASPSVRSLGKTKDLMMNPKFREGFACLQKYNLSFDAWQYFTQLPELVALAKTFPETTIIVNHTGGVLGIGPYAGKREEVFKNWQRGIVALASFPNVVMKLGGLGTAQSGFGWHERNKPPDSAELVEILAPYFLTCIEHFGTRRCMFESNFPRDKVSYSSVVLWNAFKLITKGFSSDERTALFHNTASRVYRLSNES